MQRGQVFPLSDQSVMCEIKRDPVRQGKTTVCRRAGG